MHQLKPQASSEAVCEKANPAFIESQIVSVKELRRDIDAQLQKLKGLPKSRENSLAITKIQEAIMWLGMSLKELNQLRPQPQPSPYPTSYDPSKTTVEPVADGLKL